MCSLLLRTDGQMDDRGQRPAGRGGGGLLLREHSLVNSGTGPTLSEVSLYLLLKISIQTALDKACQMSLGLCATDAAVLGLVQTLVSLSNNAHDGHESQQHHQCAGKLLYFSIATRNALVTSHLSQFAALAWLPVMRLICCIVHCASAQPSCQASSTKPRPVP